MLSVIFKLEEFRKSSLSGGNGACVEVATRSDVVGVRDSKDATSPILTFTRSEWQAFVGGVKAGEFDLG